MRTTTTPHTKKMQEQTKIQMEALRSLGMIHITGLPMHYGRDNALNGRIISAHRREWNMYGANNGMMVAILKTGEVFLSAFSNDLHNIVARICSKGSGAWVPCSNGEMIHSYHLFCRSVDPMWHGNSNNYDFHADPEQAEYAAERWEQKRRDKQLELARDGYKITLTAVPHPA
jgi:hypothetical protein